MGLNEQNRKDLINLYWNKSVLTFEEAEAAVAAAKWNMAANRIYYAMFHAVSALLIKGQHQVVTHRLSESLLEDLKVRAAQCNRSLNNYVESILAQALYGSPNPDTAEAINETRAGKYAGTLDMKDLDSFLKSIDEM